MNIKREDRELPGEYANLMYEGFAWTVMEIRKFIEAAGIFTLQLTTGEIVHFTPEDTGSFRSWLMYHQVTDIR